MVCKSDAPYINNKNVTRRNRGGGTAAKAKKTEQGVPETREKGKKIRGVQRRTGVGGGRKT